MDPPQPPPAPEVDYAALRRTAVEVLPGRLYFASLNCHPQSTAAARFVTVDYDFVYEPYFADFGPLHLGMVVRCCRALRAQLRSAEAEDAEVYFYTSHHPHQRANAACLVACFCVLVLKMAPHAADALLRTQYPPYLSFRDASYGMATFALTILDVAAGLHKAQALGWIDVDAFDVPEYDHYSGVASGDWNWIVPGRFVAFSGPIDGIPERAVKNVLGPFRQRMVRLVVRLNEMLYDRRAFTEAAIQHEELEYPDGSTPNDTVVRKFFAMCEAVPGNAAIAVHCKAGLGRTGTLIGLYVMKHYGFTAREFIGWSRLCRPGCVIGPQQQYLEAMERRIGTAGDLFRKQRPANATIGVARLPFVSPVQAAREAAASADAVLNGTLGSTKGRAAPKAAAASSSAGKGLGLRPGGSSLLSTVAGSAVAESGHQPGMSPDPMARARKAPARDLPEARAHTFVAGVTGSLNSLFADIAV